MSRKTKFSESGLSNEVCCQWLLKGKPELTAKCQWCCKEFDFSNMGEPALESHMKYKKAHGKNSATRAQNFLFLQLKKTTNLILGQIIFKEVELLLSQFNKPQ